MNQKIDQLIPQAYEAVKEHLVEEGSISRQYNGYIASFGAAVIQSGMLAALVFNHREKTRSERDRRKLMDAIFQMLRSSDGNRVQGDSLAEFYRLRLTDPRRLKKQILDAATAIKLVIRTFELKDTDTSEDDDN